MAEVEIYTKVTCPFCHAAKDLLTKKQVKFKEIPIDDSEELRQIMIKRSGQATVPQIFIDGKAVGGCDSLHALEATGKLNELLK